MNEYGDLTNYNLDSVLMCTDFILISNYKSFIPTKHLCISVQAPLFFVPYLQLTFCSGADYAFFCAVCDQFKSGANLAKKFKY